MAEFVNDAFKRKGSGPVFPELQRLAIGGVAGHQAAFDLLDEIGPVLDSKRARHQRAWQLQPKLDAGESNRARLAASGGAHPKFAAIASVGHVLQ